MVCADEVELLRAIEALIRQPLERDEEPGFEPAHRVQLTDRSGHLIGELLKPKPKKPKPRGFGQGLDRRRGKGPAKKPAKAPR